MCVSNIKRTYVSYAILEQKYSVETGTILKISTKDKKLYNEQGDKELVDISSSFSPQKLEFIKAGGSYAIVFGKKLQSFACQTLNIPLKSAYAPSKKVYNASQGLTAVEKIFNANFIELKPDSILHAGSDARVKVNIIGSDKSHSNYIAF